MAGATVDPVAPAIAAIARSRHCPVGESQTTIPRLRAARVHIDARHPFGRWAGRAHGRGDDGPPPDRDPRCGPPPRAFERNDAGRATYTPRATDVGKRVAFRVTGSKAGFATSSRTSASTGAVAAGTLTSFTPSISGPVSVGSTLVADAGNWAPSTVAFKYPWSANGDALVGATASTYKPSSATIGKKITVTVTGVKAGCTSASRTSISSASVSAGTLSGAIPKIAGSAVAGSTLTANPGTWEPSSVSFRYQ